MSRAIGENRFVYVFLGLWRGKSRAQREVGKLSQIDVVWKWRETPPRMCIRVGSSRSPDPIPEAKDNTQRGKTCNPSGKLLATSFLSGKPGLDSSSWGQGGQWWRDSPWLCAQLTHLPGEVWGGIALPQGDFQSPSPTSTIWVKCRKEGRSFPWNCCRLKVRCTEHNSPSPSSGCLNLG